eukprot:GHVU01021964.1.p3 GENE.GHVU01021964.1~~GHVU01021964.1.p3  ORF type:complete len:112 (+),score=11.51 GHVU01021964.1:535-870(+)
MRLPVPLVAVLLLPEPLLEPPSVVCVCECVCVEDARVGTGQRPRMSSGAADAHACAAGRETRRRRCSSRDVPQRRLSGFVSRFTYAVTAREREDGTMAGHPLISPTMFLRC